MYNKTIISALIFAVLSIGLIAQETVFSQSTKSGMAFSVFQLESVGATSNDIVEETTTTTTVDLSWLNTTTTTKYNPPASQPVVASNYDPGDGSRWDQLAICESGGNWAYPTVAGGFSGGLMFHEGTWNANGGQDYAPYAYMATRDQQIEIAEKVLAGSGWGAWPGCSRKFGWI